MLSGHFLFELWVVINVDVLALDLLVPADLVQALSEEDSVRENHLIKVIVDFLRDAVEVKCEDLINEHGVAISLSQLIVVASPVLLDILL